MKDTKNLPLLSRIMLWVHERFPLTNTPLFIILYIVSFIVGRYHGSPSGNSMLNLILGSILSVSFFLLLRVIDEHKDYKEDCINHPGRVLQSGTINLTHLKVLGVICLILQLAAMLFLSGNNPHLLLAWSLMMGWTFLMSKEFFAPFWLNQHFAIYAISHTLIMPFFIWWIINLANPGIEINSAIIIFMLLSFVASLSFEITHKCKGPDEERQSIVTWSMLFGRPRAISAIIILQAAMVILEYKTIHSLNIAVPQWFYLASALIYLCFLLQMWYFLSKPDITNRKRNEAIVGISMLSGYVLTGIVVYMG